MTKECKKMFTGLQANHYGQNNDIDQTTLSEYAPRGEFHAMDCTDVVFGMEKDGLSRVMDAFTR